jgi:hypothetical protein
MVAESFRRDNRLAREGMQTVVTVQWRSDVTVIAGMSYAFQSDE